MSKSRKFAFEKWSQYRSVLMGMQILLIIIFHFTEDCKKYEAGYSGLIYCFYNYIRSSGVDIFLFLSGLGLYFSWKRTPAYLFFYKKRFERILIPYAMVATAAWLWKDIFIDKEGILQFFKDITFVSFFTEGNRWFWYILMCCICYLIFPWVFRFIDGSKDEKTECIRVAIFVIIVTACAALIRKYEYELYSNISLMVLRMPAFVLGCWAGKAAYEKRMVSEWKIWGLLFVVFVIAVPMKKVYLNVIGSYILALLNFMVCFVIIVFFDCISKYKLYDFGKKILEWFGEYSLELYLLHVMVRKIMNTLGFYTYRFSNEMIMVFISMILAVGLKKITDIIQKNLNQLCWRKNV